VLAQFAEWSEWDERPVYATLRRGKHRRSEPDLHCGQRTSFKTEIKLSSFGPARPGTGFEEPPQARLVKIAHRRLAAWLDPFGMLPSQVVVNLSLKLGHGVGRVTD
jgi:hypothetical protein